MSLTPISQYASTAANYPRIASPARNPQPPKAQVQSLASGVVKEANGRSQEADAAAKTSLTVAYDRLGLQSDVGPTANVDVSQQAFRASYEQTSGADSRSQNPGTLFKSSA